MDLTNTTDPRTEQFIERWHQAAGSELATAQNFVIELCKLLGVERPRATADQDYMFERPLKEGHSDGSESDRRLDCKPTAGLTSARCRTKTPQPALPGPTRCCCAWWN